MMGKQLSCKLTKKMRSVQYGTRLIQYSILEKQGLKSHYISVEMHSGVVLKGRPVSDAIADRLILKKARWILDKLDLVKPQKDEEIVTGSRIPYLGKHYYTEVHVDHAVSEVTISFNQSKFIITVSGNTTNQPDIAYALRQFYKQKAVEKILPRINKLSLTSGLKFTNVQFRKMTKRWGSCTGTNRIIINNDAIKLPFSLIDYLIIHELCHTKVKDHSKRFWKELAKHEPKWRELDERMKQMKM
jgi:predicted metal-dependent hydrolase